MPLLLLLLLLLLSLPLLGDGDVRRDLTGHVLTFALSLPRALTLSLPARSRGSKDHPQYAKQRLAAMLKNEQMSSSLGNHVTQHASLC